MVICIIPNLMPEGQSLKMFAIRTGVISRYTCTPYRRQSGSVFMHTDTFVYTVVPQYAPVYLSSSVVIHNCISFFFLFAFPPFVLFFSVCPSICSSVCLPTVCLSLSVCVSVCLSLFLQHLSNTLHSLTKLIS